MIYIVHEEYTYNDRYIQRTIWIIDNHNMSESKTQRPFFSYEDRMIEWSRSLLRNAKILDETI